MKWYYGFLFVGLFCQTPEAEFLINSAQSVAAQLGHGSVEVTQGRSSIDVYVKSEGRFAVQLVRLSDGARITGDSGMVYGNFRREWSSLSAGSYKVYVVFIDEGLRVEEVRIEIQE